MGKNVDTITTMTFSNASSPATVQNFMAALLAKDTSGRLRPEPVSKLLTKLDSESWGFSPMYGIHGIDDNPTLLRNDSKNGHWLMVLAHGAGGNRDAVGARLVLRVGDRKHLRVVSAGSGFLSSNDPREHFGLGAATKAEELEVTWPDGRVERFPDLAADRLYTLEDSGGSKPSRLVASDL